MAAETGKLEPLVIEQQGSFAIATMPSSRCWAQASVALGKPARDERGCSARPFYGETNASPHHRTAAFH